jgi:hypothetical protein
MIKDHDICMCQPLLSQVSMLWSLFSAKDFGVFLEINVMTNFRHKIAVFWFKITIFHIFFGDFYCPQEDYYKVTRDLTLVFSRWIMQPSGSALVRYTGSPWAPGIDFMKILFDRNVLGQIFILHFWTNFHPKNNRCKWIWLLWTIFLDLEVFKAVSGHNSNLNLTLS